MASLFSSVFLSLCLLFSPFLSNANSNTKLGFTADLIHRDSPKSPFYNPTETPSQRLKNAINRSIDRVFHFTHLSRNNASLSSPQSNITFRGGEYLMSISLGTPPFPVMLLLDTGSDLIWTQCRPCNDCYPQVGPLFDPKSSSTYKDVSCPSIQCLTLIDSASTNCSTEGNVCTYVSTYGDQSYSEGNIAVDTLTLGSTDYRPVQLKNVTIGCGYINNRPYNVTDSGVIGLGRGSASLITQLGDSIEGKFSYCLTSSKNSKPSKINFGTNAIVSGTGVISTPLIQKTLETLYYLNLESISVGNKRLKYTSSSDVIGKGNIIIDSGTTMTVLYSEFYSKLEATVASLINAEKKQDPQGDLSLCYSATADLRLPNITMHFKGADLKLDSSNTFISSEDTVCFAFFGSEEFSILGNIAQMNFLVGYDTVSKKVSFKPTDCGKM